MYEWSKFLKELILKGLLMHDSLKNIKVLPKKMQCEYIFKSLTTYNISYDINEETIF